jgi:tetratricopeptide (TPR) repeat protein
MDLEAVLTRALDLGEEGDWEGMAKELREALPEFPDNAPILCWLGVAEHETGLGGVAYDRFKAAAALQPEDPYLLVTIGNGLARFDDPDAESALRSAALMAPELPLARCMYGAYLAREGLLPDALRELEAAVALAPDDPTVVYELGVALSLSGDLETGLEYLTRGVDLNPRDGWTQVVMGLVEVELDRMEEANRDLSEGARQRPEDAEAQLLASLTAHAEGWEDLAFEMLERARQVVSGPELPLLEAIEARLEEGGAEAEAFLKQEVLPTILRERLMSRP